MSLTRQALRVCAALTGLRGARQDDVLDTLIPFLVPIIQACNGAAFTSKLLVIGTKKLYGWNITAQVADAFAERLLERGYLSEKKSTDIMICTPPSEDGQVSVSDYETQMEFIASQFVDFCKNNHPLFLERKNNTDYKDLLIRFIVSLDAYGTDDIFAEVQSFNREELISSPIANLSSGSGALDETDRYVCAQFVSELYSSNSPYIKSLGELAGVGLLTELVQDFVKPASIKTRSDLVVFLDAPLAMQLLGVAGKASRQEAELVYKSLRSIGVQFYILPVSCREIERVLKAVLKASPPDRYGPTHTALLKQEVDEDFVSYVQTNPDTALKKFGIAQRPATLKSNPSTHKYFTIEQYDDIYSRFSWEEPAAREHDAECVSITMRLREGKHRRDPLDNRYLFATINSAVARRSRSYCLQNRLIQDTQYGPVITYTDLATIAWLRTGFGASDLVPRGYLLNVCGQILAVKKEVVATARNLIQQVTPERMIEMELLLHDRRATLRLMDQAHGILEDGTQDLDQRRSNAHQLLDLMIEAATGMAEKIYEKDKESLTKIYEEQISSLKSKSEGEMRERDQYIARQAEQIAQIKEELDDLSKKTLILQNTVSLTMQEEFSRISKAVHFTNLWLQAIEKFISYAVYSAAFVSACGLTVSAFMPEYSSNFLNIFSVAFGIIGTYYVVQDFRKKPKRVLDDLIRGFASRKLRRELIRFDAPVTRALDEFALVDMRFTPRK